jgi:rhodanese-related sulfurtransferase
MKSSNLLLGLMALACLLVQACAAEDSPELVDQKKVDLMNTQFIEGKKTETGSYKGQPWATSSLNESNKRLVQPSDYMVMADSFLKEAANNGFYVLSVAQFINITRADNNWVIVDVRPAQLYAGGHISGAINIPLADLVSQMGTIPAGQKVAVYCAIDTNAALAVQTLRVYGGRDAFILSGGIASWQAAGMPVVT